MQAKSPASAVLLCFAFSPTLAENTIGFWSVDAVNTVNDFGRSPSLAILHSGEPAIAYYEFANGVLE